MIDSPRILQTENVPTATIHLTIPRAEIQHVMGPAHAELTAVLRAQGIEPAGPWFTRHFRMDPAVFDFEVGFPVARAVEASGRVRPSELPASAVARTVYHGGYEGLAGAWPQLDAWIASQGRKAAPGLWEIYLTDPSSAPDPTSWRTELNRPLLE